MVNILAGIVHADTEESLNQGNQFESFRWVNLSMFGIY